MFKAIRTSVVNVEPGRVLQIFPNKNVCVDTESLSSVRDCDKGRNCVVLSLESGPNSTLTDHVLTNKTACDLLIDLIGSLSALGNPIALTLRDFLPTSIDDIPMEYR